MKPLKQRGRRGLRQGVAEGGLLDVAFCWEQCQRGVIGIALQQGGAANATVKKNGERLAVTGTALGTQP